MIRSMTGFGRGEYREDGREFGVEIKTVNHRYSDVFIKMPRQLSFLEDRVRDLAGKRLSRGKIDIYISYEDRSEETRRVVFDEALAKAYVDALRKLKDRFGLEDDISVSLVSRFPDILRVEQVEEDEEKLWLMLKEALTGALDSLVAMRENEGEGLREDLLGRVSGMEALLGEVAARAPEVVREYKQKLAVRIKELMEQQTIDEGRLAVEVAIFADRCSIDEEITRLKSHLAQMAEAFRMEQPVGRKLDFLVQEMNREVNTIGSKANDLEITKCVLEMKSSIEKIREQIQNIE